MSFSLSLGDEVDDLSRLLEESEEDAETETEASFVFESFDESVSAATSKEAVETEGDAALRILSAPVRWREPSKGLLSSQQSHDDADTGSEMESESRVESESGDDAEMVSANADDETEDESESVASERGEESHLWPTRMQMYRLMKGSTVGESGEHCSFGQRTLVIRALPRAITEETLTHKLFYDLPTELQPLDVVIFKPLIAELQHSAKCKQKSQSSKRSANEWAEDWLEEVKWKSAADAFAHLIFDSRETVDRLVPNLAAKRELCVERDYSLKDALDGHLLATASVHCTRRLLFLNLSWDTPPRVLLRFVSRCLQQWYESTALRSSRKQQLAALCDAKCQLAIHSWKDLLPVRVHILTDANGYNTQTAFVDCKSPQIASLIVQCCHLQLLNGRLVFVDWHLTGGYVAAFVKRQLQLAAKSTHSIAICGLPKAVGEAEIRGVLQRVVRKKKRKAATGEWAIEDCRVVHCRHNPKGLKLGVCFVSFSHCECAAFVQKALQYRAIGSLPVFVALANDRKVRAPASEGLKHKTHWVLLSNLQWHVSDTAICDTLRRCALPVPTEVEVECDSELYPLGTALLQFATKKAASKVVAALRTAEVRCLGRVVEADWCQRESHTPSKGVSQWIRATDGSKLHAATADSLWSQMAETKARALKKEMFGRAARHFSKRRATASGRVALAQMAANEDVVTHYATGEAELRRQRRRDHALATRNMVDLKMLKLLKRGIPLSAAAPLNPRQLRQKKRRQNRNIGPWTKFNIRKSAWKKLKQQRDWKTGKAMLPRLIAAKKGVRLKNYWADSRKFSRRRTRNHSYIQKDRSKFRKTKKR